MTPSEKARAAAARMALTPAALSAFPETIFHRNLRDFYRGLQRGECLTGAEPEAQFERPWREVWVEGPRGDPGRLDEGMRRRQAGSRLLQTRGWIEL